jgi:hypothetical protein
MTFHTAGPNISRRRGRGLRRCQSQQKVIPESFSFALLPRCHRAKVKPWKVGAYLPQSSNCHGDIFRDHRYKRYIGS